MEPNKDNWLRRVEQSRDKTDVYILKKELTQDINKLEKANEEQAQLNKTQLKNGKETAYYSALVTAYISSGLEKDKQLLTVSSALAAFALGGLKIIGDLDFSKWKIAPTAAVSSLLLICALFGAYKVISSILKVFDVNNRYIMYLLEETEQGDDPNDQLDDLEKSILKYFKFATGSIILGGVFLFVTLIINNWGKP